MKKVTIVIWLCVVMLSTAGVQASGGDGMLYDFSHIYDLLFEEDFAYEPESFLEQYDCTGGIGFAGKWAADCDTFERTPITVNDSVPRIRKDAFGTYLCDWGTEQNLYRKLEETACLEDGMIYELTALERDSTLENTNLDWKIRLGETDIYFGQKARASLAKAYYAQLCAGGEIAFSEQPFIASTYYRYKLRIEPKADEADVVALKVWEMSSPEPETDTIVISCELSGAEFTYVSVESGERCLCLSGFRMWKSNRTLIEDFENRMQKIQQATADINDCRNAYAALSYLVGQMDVQKDTALLKQYLETQGWTDAVEVPQQLSASVAEGAQYQRGELREIMLTYSSKLSGAEAALFCEGDAVDAEISISSNRVALIPHSPLQYGKAYTLQIQNLTDTFGNAAANSEISFYTNYIPDINIIADGVYSQYTKIHWDDSFADKIEGYLTNGEEEQTLANDDAMTLSGEVTLKIVVTYGRETQSKTWEFTLAKAYAPYADNLKITGSATVGGTLQASYEYHDENGDAEGESKYAWLRCSTKDGVYERIADADALTYTLTEVDNNTYIKFEVLPISVGEYLCEGEPVVSGSFTAPFAPVAQNVRIAKSGAANILSGYYDFYDENFDESGSAIVYWTLRGNETKISAATTLEVNKNLDGKDVVFHVIPVSVKEPFRGECYSSEPYRVSYNKGGSSSSGGGGSSSAGGSFYQASASGSSAFTNTDGTPSKPEAPAVETPVFADIQAHWAKDIIIALYNKGIVKGVEEHVFAPDRPITRAEFLALLLRNEDEELSYAGGYADVFAQDWFSRYVALAQDKSIISADELFRPGDHLTRQEACKLIALYLSLPIGSDSGLADADEISPWAAEYVDCCVAAGLVIGDSDRYFRPFDSLTRAESAVIVDRILNREGGDGK